jgi:hypothetical protein
VTFKVSDIRGSKMMRYIVLGILIGVFCFVPIVEAEYIVVAEKQVLEPYTVLEQVKEPYYDTYNDVDWGPVDRHESFYPTTEQRIVTRYKTVTKEVTKTRLVTRPVAETRMKRVSILGYLLK